MIFPDASRQQRASRNSAKRLSTHVIIDLSRRGAAESSYRLELIDDEKRAAQRYCAREKFVCTCANRDAAPDALSVAFRKKIDRPVRVG